MTVPIIASDHAVDRYHERVKPALDRDAAERELLALLATVPATEAKPEWLYIPEGLVNITSYCELSEGIVAPLRRHVPVRGFIACTILIRSDLEPSWRAHVRHKSSVKRAAKQRANRKGSKRKKASRNAERRATGGPTE
jgi:hypothetical protein